MPIPVVCPNGHRMTLPDHLGGKRYRCPLCFMYIEVPAAGSVPPPETAKVPDGAAAPPKTNLLPVTPLEGLHALPPGLQREEREGVRPRGEMDRIARGLSCHYARLVTLLVSLLGIYVVAVVGEFLPRDTFWAAAVVLSAGLFLLAPILGLVGSLFCLGVSAEGGAKHWLVLSLLFDLTTLPLGYFSGHFEGPGDDAAVAWLAGVFLQTLAWACASGFLRQLARQLHQHAAADAVLRDLFKGIALFLLPPVFFGGLYRLSYSLGGDAWIWLFAVQSLPLVIYTLVFAGKFLVEQNGLVNSLRQVIRSRP
jgi:hypothetical protein